MTEETINMLKHIKNSVSLLFEQVSVQHYAIWRGFEGDFQHVHTFFQPWISRSKSSGLQCLNAYINKRFPWAQITANSQLSMALHVTIINPNTLIRGFHFLCRWGLIRWPWCTKTWLCAPFSGADNSNNTAVIVCADPTVILLQRTMTYVHKTCYSQ